MALFPKIQSPCPYQANLAAIMDGDLCRMCKRQVTDLTAMDDAARIAFFENCETEVCVSYRVPVRSALGAAALAAAAVAALPAAAQDAPPPTQEVTVAAAMAEPANLDDEIIVMGGGIHDPRNVEFVETPEDAKLPELPVVYETPKPAEPAKRD
ncbi:hypothetical protein OF829_02635 [Sphingomonas sp. LB-2]|uniref:hypothetical protein n=1 Tax=Sphingomonas caeni TaxID=2984949 RepID=UPI002232669A|nr:hypothetical protein [Sphingomonas caeni]MCW3846118.1 hypothetical protein [Sphingomonas caeni]